MDPYRDNMGHRVSDMGHWSPPHLGANQSLQLDFPSKAREAQGFNLKLEGWHASWHLS